MLRLPLSLLLACACLAQSPAKIDNDAVYIHTGLDVPGHKGPLHRHELNRVMIYLDSGDITITHPGDADEHQHWRAGDVAWSPAGGMHTSEAVGTAPIHIVEIELKHPAPVKAPVRNVALDPVAIDPEHNVPLFENAQVRVFRSWREAGGSEKMHEHTGVGRATVMLTDIDASVKLIDGSVNQLVKKRGESVWSGPVTHATKNNGPNRIDMVVVEVK